MTCVLQFPYCRPIAMIDLARSYATDAVANPSSIS